MIYIFNETQWEGLSLPAVQSLHIQFTVLSYISPHIEPRVSETDNSSEQAHIQMQFISRTKKKIGKYLILLFYAQDCLCGLVVRVPGYKTEMYCVSCEVRTEFIYVM
jgi:hypothetical protein